MTHFTEYMKSLKNTIFGVKAIIENEQDICRVLSLPKPVRVCSGDYYGINGISGQLIITFIVTDKELFEAKNLLVRPVLYLTEEIVNKMKIKKLNQEEIFTVKLLYNL